MREIGVGRVASVCGRYYAMDRDNRWDRVEAAYRMLTEGVGRLATSPVEAFQWYYDNPTEASRQGDEFVVPTVIADDGQTPRALVRDGDAVVFFNFRGDRAREITKAFTYDEFPFAGHARGGQLDPVSVVGKAGSGIAGVSGGHT